MGQTLSSPVQTKRTEYDTNKRFSYAISEMQGWRVSMEDAHTTLLKLNEEAPDEETDSFFAVFDGHGGGSVARYAGDNVYKRLAKEESYLERSYEKALKRSFMGTDEDLRADPAFFRDPSGCTAVAALITHDSRIFVANAGDSRSVLSVGGEAKPLSFDHKPDSQVEYNRIKAAGGYIEGGRVCGNLSLSRAIGDFEFKKEYSLEPEAQIITSNPDITEHHISEDDEFLILACDGIWDCLSSQQCVDYIRLSLHKRKTLTEICEECMEHCLSPDSTGGIGMDNMTILVVAILHGRTLEQWYDWMAERVEKKVGYNTPTEYPQVYSAGRIMMATERQRRARENPRNAYDDEDDDERPSYRSGPLSGLARILGGGGDMSFIPVDEGRGGKGNNITLFGDDSSDDDSDEDVHKWVAAEDSGLQLVDDDSDAMLVDEEGSMPNHQHFTFNGNSNSNKAEGEAPPPPHSSTQDSSKFQPSQVPHSFPSGDAASASTKADGLLDKSEDPLKNALTT